LHNNTISYSFLPFGRPAKNFRTQGVVILVDDDEDDVVRAMWVVPVFDVVAGGAFTVFVVVEVEADILGFIVVFVSAALLVVILGAWAFVAVGGGSVVVVVG
jgi:hypothetical protein